MDTTVQQLLHIIQELRDENRLQREEYKRQFDALIAINEGLRAEIAELKRLLFEKKSEKNPSKSKRMPKSTSKQKTSQDKIQKVRKEKRDQQKSLPVEIIKIPVEESQCSCDCCEPGQFKVIGSKLVERIEYIPSVLKRYQYHLQTKKCTKIFV